MKNPTDEIVAALERDWPDWQIWVIHKAVGGITWCARRWDGSGQAINTDSAEHLAAYLEDETGR